MKRNLVAFVGVFVGLMVTGCQKQAPGPAAGGGMQALPVQTTVVALAPVPLSTDYVATIKSRRSATLQPQVDGRLTGITVKSGDHVQAGQQMMAIDPLHQQASVDAQLATERQKKALYDYNSLQIVRQKKLFEEGIISRDLYEQAQQAFDNSKADYESAVASRKTQEEQLAYYTIRAPFDGVVGDVPVHVGDYVSATTVLTTLDENKDLEAYIFVPTERERQLRQGLEVDLMDTSDKLLEKTRIDFMSPQVDNTLQGILVKAPVHLRLDVVRTAQLVKAKIVWTTSPKAVVPVLAVTRLGGQTFVYVAENEGGKYLAKQRSITVGDTVGNDYAVESGLKAGDKVIISGMQFLMDGAPVMPLPPGPAGPAPQGGAAGQ